MADFINSETYEIRRSVNEPDLDGKPGWHRLKDKSGLRYVLPECHVKYWKGFPPEEMTVGEKSAADEAEDLANFNNRSDGQIALDILSSFEGEEQQVVADAMDAAFDRALRARRFDICRARIARAVVKEKLTQEQADTILAILPE